MNVDSVPSPMKVTAATRSRARHYAMQVIYQWQMTAKPIHIIEQEFVADNDMAKVDMAYFEELIRQVVEQQQTLDQHFLPHLKSVTLEQLDPITLSLLRIACYEFSARVDVPYRVVINEAVNLAKKFGAAESHKFINGVLDKVAPKLRAAEVRDTKAGHNKN